jgi:hypothetical protein
VNWKLMFVSVVGLALLEGVLANRQNTSRVGAVENAVVTLFQKFVDPSTPAFAVKAKKP